MKAIKWSHSGLKDFEGCARRFHEVKVLKKYPFTDTVHTIYGKQVHESAELYIRDGVPLPPEHEFIQPTLDALMKKTGRKLTEHTMGVTVDLKPCSFDDPDVWVRGIADLLIIDDDGLKAKVLDYKTGNDRYPDRDQLTLMSLMVFTHFPHIRQVNSALLFVVKNTMVTQVMTVDEKEFHWSQYRERVARLEQSYANDVWNPTSTPLCGWCQVKSCEFNPKH
jgi:PD-(D/E)XK nuclease superfamily